MKKKKFNPQQWLNTAQNTNNVHSNSPVDARADFLPWFRGGGPPTAEAVRADSDNTSQNAFEEARIHHPPTRILTKSTSPPTYADWRNIGFAFADEFGESGRELFPPD